MVLVGGYFNKEQVFQDNFDDGGGIVLFEAATLVYFDSDDADAPASETQLHKSYAGFVYGTINTYNINTNGGTNNSKMVVVNAEGKSFDVNILDYDMDGDGTKDSLSTHMQYGFFYIDLDQDTYGSIREIVLIDKDGNEFARVETGDLTYSEPFFTDVDDFLKEYNRDYTSDKLTELNTEFLAKNENYTISSDGVAQSSADVKSAVIVVVYFVFIYIIGDLLVGERYVIKFFRWLLVKVFKVKFKSKPAKQETFGHDYYSKVTLVLDVSAISDFSQSVMIRYNNEKGEEIVFSLLKEENYTSTQRVKAGTYVNMWIDIDKTIYSTQNLPETLQVEGYQQAIKIKIIKREEERL